MVGASRICVSIRPRAATGPADPPRIGPGRPLLIGVEMPTRIHVALCSMAALLAACEAGPPGPTSAASVASVSQAVGGCGICTPLDQCHEAGECDPDTFE